MPGGRGRQNSAGSSRRGRQLWSTCARGLHRELAGQHVAPAGKPEVVVPLPGDERMLRAGLESTDARNPGAGVVTTLLLVSVLALGCSERPEISPGARATVDTVGGTVHVRYTGSLPVADLTETARIGRVGGAEEDGSPDEFGRVVGVVADAGGAMYVADALALEVRVFSPDGEFVRRMGRSGQGPGEFGGLHGITWLSGDTLVLMDYGNARLSLMRADGEVAGQWNWMRLTGPARFLFNTGPGEIYAHAYRMSAGDGSGRGLWVRYTAEGAGDSLAIPTAPQKPGSLATCRGNGIGYFDNPFGDQLLSGPAPNEERIVAWSSQYRIAFLNPAGDTVRVISRDISPMALSDSLWAPVAESYAKFRADWAGADCRNGSSGPRRGPSSRP